RSCVLTSSLLACIWGDCTLQDYPCVINHHSWSDEPFCRDKRLWYALGKLRAEKAAWSKAKEKGVKLATICPGLVTGPEFFARNPTSTVAYLKGAQEMYADGVLATVDVCRWICNQKKSLLIRKTSFSSMIYNIFPSFHGSNTYNVKQFHHRWE
ncbi:Cinnamoyl-CoA reductase-like SNL6, partial [Linum perenne]